MKMRHILLTLFLTICFSSIGQVDAYQQDIINYLKINGTPSKYSKAYDNVFVLLEKQFQSANVPEPFWVKLKKGKKKDIEEVIRVLSFAYRKHFTQQEINQMHDFYKTDTAQKMLDETCDLSEEENKEIQLFIESELGKKITEKKEELSDDISEIVGHWNRELFASKMSMLVKAGFSPKK